MSVNWGNLLAGLERHVRDNPWDPPAGDAPPQPGWRSRPPATDAQIGDLEARIGVRFPPCYVAFLRTCNGLDLASHPIQRFLGADDVNWFRRKHNDWVRAYTMPQPPQADREPPDDEYYGYADDVRTFFRPRHFRHTIQITAVGDSAVYLLNPQVVWPSGEWEAWFLANWNPGVVRYRSFAELMWDLYGGQTGLDEPTFGLVREAGLPTVYGDPPGKPDRRTKKLRVLPPPRPIDAIARDVRYGDYPKLRKAINELARLRTSAAVEMLATVLRTHPVEEVREDAAIALGKCRHPDAVPVLVEALRDEYSPTVNMVVNALADTRDGRAVEPLLRLLKKRPVFLVETLAGTLARLNEPRAAEVLGEILRTGEPGDHRGADNAAALLSEFGDAGCRVLVDAMETGDARAKLRAARSAYHFQAADVGPALRKLSADRDEGVRRAATEALALLPLIGRGKGR